MFSIPLPSAIRTHSLKNIEEINRLTIEFENFSWNIYKLYSSKLSQEKHSWLSRYVVIFTNIRFEKKLNNSKQYMDKFMQYLYKLLWEVASAMFTTTSPSSLPLARRRLSNAVFSSMKFATTLNKRIIFCFLFLDQERRIIFYLMQIILEKLND